MGKVLIIGAGGVATVAAHKVAQHPEVFDEIMIASRTKAKCDAIVKAIGNPSIQTAKVDADNVEELVELLNGYKPDMVMNLALPYQDLTIMEACLQTGCNYLDTANYEPKDVAHFEYSWQWAYKKRFEEAGLTAILGCGFDRAFPVCIRHTRPNIISMKSITWTSWTAMREIIIRLLPQTSIRKSTSAKLLRTDVITRTDSGWRRSLWKSIRT